MAKQAPPADGTEWLRDLVKVMAHKRTPPWEREAAHYHFRRLLGLERPIHLEDDETVSQTANTKPFREEPRWDKPEIDVSMVRGKLDADTAHRSAFNGAPARPSTRVRHFAVGYLRHSGYCTFHTPREPGSLHVSVTSPTDLNLEQMKAWWARPARVTLEELATTPD